MDAKKDRSAYKLDFAKSHYKRIPLDVRIEEYEGLKDHVSKTGETINGALRRAIREMIEQDTQAP